MQLEFVSDFNTYQKWRKHDKKKTNYMYMLCIQNITFFN